MDKEGRGLFGAGPGMGSKDKAGGADADAGMGAWTGAAAGPDAHGDARDGAPWPPDGEDGTDGGDRPDGADGAGEADDDASGGLDGEEEELYRSYLSRQSQRRKATIILVAVGAAGAAAAIAIAGIMHLGRGQAQALAGMASVEVVALAEPTPPELQEEGKVVEGWRDYLFGQSERKHQSLSRTGGAGTSAEPKIETGRMQMGLANPATGRIFFTEGEEAAPAGLEEDAGRDADGGAAQEGQEAKDGSDGQEAQDGGDGQGDAAKADPVKHIIMDLDYAAEVDDTCALRMAAQLHKEGRIELMAVMVSTAEENCPKAAHAQLSYDGLPGVPIGESVVQNNSASPFWGGFVSRYFDSTTYRHSDAVSLYIQTLKECAAKGKKARIVIGGYPTNFAELLRRNDGFELVKANVDHVFMTGGAYPNGKDMNFSYAPSTAAAIKYAQANCPVPIVYSTELSTIAAGGSFIYCGRAAMDRDGAVVDPVCMALRGYESNNGTELPQGTVARSPMCTLAACLGPEESRLQLEPRYIMFDDGGGNGFYNDSKVYNCYIVSPESGDGAWYTSQMDAIILRGMK